MEELANWIRIKSLLITFLRSWRLKMLNFVKESEIVCLWTSIRMMKLKQAFIHQMKKEVVLEKYAILSQNLNV